MFFDAHNHLQDDSLSPQLDAITTELDALPISGMVVNGTCQDDWARVAELATLHPWIYPSYGLHPWDAGNRTEDWFEQLRAQLAADPSAAIGEIGIDRWMTDRARSDDHRLTGLRRAPLPEQIEVMRQQLDLACHDDRPVTLHCLQAWGTLAEILEAGNLPKRGFLLHAYAGPAELIPRFVRLGAYFSFNPSFLPPHPAGPFDHARLENFRQIPADRLLVETDAPAMPPPPAWQTHPLPAPLNHPGNIVAAYHGLAALRAQPLDALVPLVAANFTRLFDSSPA